MRKVNRDTGKWRQKNDRIIATKLLPVDHIMAIDGDAGPNSENSYN